MKSYPLLVPVIAICLLLAGARSPVTGQAPDPAPRLQAQPDAPLAPMYRHFHPRFYKEYGETGRSSTLYLQNPNPTAGSYVLAFYDCASGAEAFPPASPIWDIPPGATRVAGPGDFPDLPPGCYGLVITSDMSLAHASLVEDAWNGGPAAGTLAAYPGFTGEEAASELRFGPLLKGEVNSTVHIWNVGYASATLTANAYDASGAPIALPSCTLAPYAQCSYDASALAQLPPAFLGTLAVQSPGGSIMGIMALESTSAGIGEYRRPAAAGAAEACLPRALRHANEGGRLRSTTLLVANTANQASNASLVFYAANGAPSAANPSFSLAANGSRFLRLADIAQLADGVWSVCASGPSLALEELTQAEAPAGSPASSATRAGNMLGTSMLADLAHLALTHLMRTGASYTAFSLQNPGGAAASVDLRYYDLAGALVYTDTVNLPPKGWVRFNQGAQTELGHDYAGSPVVSSTQPLVSLVDVYAPPAPERIFLPLVRFKVGIHPMDANLPPPDGCQLAPHKIRLTARRLGAYNVAVLRDKHNIIPL